MSIREGQVVRSKAGRDNGRFLVALRVEDGYAWVADGGLRPAARPKRKKLRHLAPTNRFAAIDVHAATDKELRRALRELAPDARLERDDKPEEG